MNQLCFELVTNPMTFKLMSPIMNMDLIFSFVNCFLSFFLQISSNNLYISIKLQSFPQNLSISTSIVVFSRVGCTVSIRLRSSIGPFFLLKSYLFLSGQHLHPRIFDESMIDLSISPPISGFNLELTFLSEQLLAITL